ncbi:MAG TPA: hypothetical protein VN848_06100 [Gemmatimonadales bacterium]|nr:hypothetical protein [Gemmatimonadales bacterium]
MKRSDQGSARLYLFVDGLYEPSGPTGFTREAVHSAWASCHKVSAHL